MHALMPSTRLCHSFIYFLCGNGAPYPSSHSLAPHLLSVFSCTALIKRFFLWELLWSLVPNAKFFPFISSNTINLRHFFPLHLYLLLATQLPFQSNFLIFFSEIAAGDCVWGGRRGRGHQLTLGSINDLCVCACLCMCLPRLLLYFYAPCGVNSVPLGWEGGQPTVQRTMKARTENFCSLQVMHN